MFIGRESELSTLNEMYSSGRFQLLVLYGRRRIGKTTLLNEFCKDKDSIFYSAEQSLDKINLGKFSEIVCEYYNDKYNSGFGSWTDALMYINDRQKDSPLVLVLDEFPYIAESNKSLMSQMQHIIDHTLKDGKLFIILCGSYMGFMEKEVLGSKSPLFGRRTGQIKLKAFDYLESAKFTPDYSYEAKLMTYGAFGGTPHYLQIINDRKPLKDNIVSNFLKPAGYLYSEPQLLLQQEIQNPRMYRTIIEAIACGAAKCSEIAAKTGEEASKCLKYIDTLTELGILYKETPFGEKESSRKSIYGIDDWMFRFYYRFVGANQTLLETGAAEIVWDKKIKPDYSRYMGFVFEQVCKDYLMRKNAQGKLPILFTQIGRWWGTDSKTKSQVEIDIVAKDGNNYIFGECKWRNELLDYAVYEALVHKAKVFGGKQDSVDFMLFSKSGFTNAVAAEAEKNEHLHLVTLNDLFEA